MRSKKRILILGGTGMLGHKLWQVLRQRFDCYVTIRQERLVLPGNLFDRKRTICAVSADDIQTVKRALRIAKPKIVINCIGIVKQRLDSQDLTTPIQINSLFPHQLTKLCSRINARLIHFSTDCVFSGSKGNYKENDLADAKDLYGLTKYLGEVNKKNCLTLRTSIVGHELKSKKGLLEWFLSQKGKTVKGYSRAIFNGLTTNVLAKLILEIIIKNKPVGGIWHISSNPISKFDLLKIINKVYQLNIEIIKDDSLCINRSLDSSALRKKIGIKIPGWKIMVKQMYNDYLYCQKNINIYVKK